MTPTRPELFAAIETTWPAARTWRQDGWVFRDGAGGGKRVSAATADCPDAEIAALGDWPLVQIRPGQDALDARLAAAGFGRVDPTRILMAKTAGLAGVAIPRVTAFTVWEPLKIMEEIWDEGGIGPARRAVMMRMAGPKTGLLARTQDHPTGAAFLAGHGKIAMVHALEIRRAQRRHRAATWLMHMAANWAAAHQMPWLAVLVTTQNTGAGAFYDRLGFTEVGGYHYRVKQSVIKS